MKKEDKWEAVPLEKLESWAEYHWSIMTICFWRKCRDLVLRMQKPLNITFGSGIMKRFELMAGMAFSGMPDLEGLDTLCFTANLCSFLKEKGVL